MLPAKATKIQAITSIRICAVSYTHLEKTMKALAYIISAVFAYFVSGLNPAIIMSKAIYKKDIRTCGSGNPGFTNFKRVFGNKYAWFVFVLDILKGAVISVVAGLLFRAYVGSWALGVAYAGLFAMLGHAFPLYYGFKGGKGLDVYKRQRHGFHVCRYMQNLRKNPFS